VLYLLAFMVPPLAIVWSRHPSRWSHAFGNIFLLAGYPLAVAHAFWVLGNQPPRQPDDNRAASARSETHTAIIVAAVVVLLVVVGGLYRSPDSSASAFLAMATATPLPTIAPRGEWVEVEDVSNNATDVRAMIRIANVQEQSACPDYGTVKAPSGAKFVVVTLEGTSTWDEQVQIPYVADFQLAGRYKAGLGSGTLSNHCVYSPASWGNTVKKIYKEATVSGWLLFEVPVAFDPAGTVLEGSISCRTCIRQGATTRSYAWRL